MSYKRFDPEDVVVSAESITSPIWSGDSTTLTTFFTSSTQTGGASGDYYYDIYQTASNLTGARVQFSVAYADKLGSGSLLFNSNVEGKAPSSTVFGQYRNLVLGDENTDFTFGEVNSDHFYAINVDRARYKEKILPGTLDLKLNISGSTNVLRLTDNSKVVSTTSFTDSGRVFELITGSIGTLATGKVQSNGYTSNSGSYGKLLPDIGVLLINGNALKAPVANGGLAFTSSRGNNALGNNNLASFYELLNYGSNFRLQSEETISSNFIFVRARNSEFNYSTNPSIITGSGELIHNVMINTPQSYMTTVGLYNDNNDLLAVAKLSRPLLKDFTKESLIRIKLDY
jgi:hypothetical protein